MKFAYILILFSLLAGDCYAQSNAFIEDSLKKLMQNDTLVIWDKNRKLTFADFQGVPPVDTAYAANSQTVFLMIYNNDTPFEIKVVCALSKKRSWYYPGLYDENTLQHEQGHFDIAQYHAYWLNDSFSKMINTCTKQNFENKIRKVHNYFVEKCNEMQLNYDAETKNSLDEKEQYLWNDFINNLINVLTQLNE